jgi:hypothetical protein
MKIYRLQSIAEAQGDLVSLGDDRSGRLMRYFIKGDNDGKFLQFTKLKAQAQPLLTVDAIKDADFLEADVSIPVFSIRAAEILKENAPEEFEFHPIFITVGDAEREYRLCKVKIYTKMIDSAHSSFIEFSDKTRIINEAMYFSRFDCQFYMARDLEHVSRYVASEKFVALCQRYTLNIAFAELRQNE